MFYNINSKFHTIARIIHIKKEKSFYYSVKQNVVHICNAHWKQPQKNFSKSEDRTKQSERQELGLQYDCSTP